MKFVDVSDLPVLGDRYRLIQHIGEDYIKVEDLDENSKQKDVFIFSASDADAKQVIDKFSSIRNSSVRKCERFIENERLYAVQECWTSLNLIERLEKLRANHALFEEQIVYWFYHIIRGVDCLHNNNLLYCQISEHWLVFVFDELKFTLNPQAFIVANKDEEKVVEAPELICLNAPEYIKSKTISLKYDIWCAGWLLYHMCTLTSPFDLLNSVSDFCEWTEKPKLPAGFSAELVDVFEKMTQINQDARPTSSDLLSLPLFVSYELDLNKDLLKEGRYKRLSDCKRSDDVTICACDLSAGRQSATSPRTPREQRIVGMQRYLKSDKKTFELLAAYQKIAHENLASILDLFYDGGFFYAVENFAESILYEEMEPLREDKARHKEKALLWSGQLISALHFIHKANIIHKFIHIGRVGFIGGRIKLSTHHKSELLKRPILDETGSSSSSEREYLTIYNGEFGYYAPEIVRAMRISYKYDIWSLGWTLYYIASFNDMQLALQELGDFGSFTCNDLPFPDYLRDETKLVQTIQSMLAVDEDARPGTAELTSLTEKAGAAASSSSASNQL